VTPDEAGKRKDGSLRLLAPAKVNLFLEVLGKRPDGYHEIVTVIQTVSLCDEVILRPRPSGIELVCDDDSLPQDPSNLAYRAAAAVLEHSRYDYGLSIEVRKQIPAAAGLGGGSSDAAAVIRGVNRLFGLNLEAEALSAIAAGVGSDVPFFLTGGVALCTGRGEVVRAISSRLLDSGYGCC